MIKITIDCQYHRDQLDDWLVGGKVEVKGKQYYWSAQNNNYGFGWEIEPVTEEDWSRFDEGEFNELMKIIEKCILEHKTEYIVS